MIRAFNRSDIRRIKANEFSKPNDLAFVFYDEEFYKNTLVGDDGDVYAIICFRRYWHNNFLAFFLISEDMPFIYARQLKKFLLDAIIDFRAERVQTDSRDCAILNRWHKFLGFTLEGKREKMIFDLDYNMWGLLKGRDF